MYESDKTIKFEVVTPERVVLKEFIHQVTVPTRAGEITVLPNHEPLISVLKPGVIELKKENGDMEIMSVSGGFIEVLKNKVVILADTAERAEELDLRRAEEARERAAKIKDETRHEDAESFAAITAQLDKELARTKAISRWKKIKKMN
ncbi:MAG: ATP synthase F1 subunit epsilon [Patescibacteria group bacterium]|nr:ATP synthase F1 subunit epsilon [Patescibacteria group bacterium]MDD5554978.1 ATP synthase F1 subunit epsilon [Patescibacteria group bacterium]